MVTIPFCYGTYQDKTLNANAQDAINLYPMKTKIAANSDKKTSYPQPEQIIMYPSPGYKFQVNLQAVAKAAGPIRGEFAINNTLYIVAGSSLVLCTPIGGNTNLAEAIYRIVGTLNTAVGWVSIVCNTVSLVISDGQFGYTYNLSTESFATIGSSGGFPATGGVTNFTFFDSYVLAAQNNSRTVIQSNVLDAETWGAQAFDTLVSMADNLVGVFSDGLQLYCFGPKITEVQADAGQIPYAFEKVPNVLIQAGCAAVATICKIGNTVMFLASDIAGKCYVAALEGYATKVLSTPPMNEAMERYPTVSNAYSYVYREADNMFYVITFPGIATWAYDTSMQMWHKRVTVGNTDLPTCCALWNGMQVVGDANGNLSVMSQDYCTYPVYNPNTGTVVDVPLERTRVAAHVNNEGKTLFISELWVDMQTGTGFFDDALLAQQPQTQPKIPTIVQQAGANNGENNVTLNQPTTAGNLLAIYIGFTSSPDTILGVTDDLGQTWLQASGAQATDPTNQNVSDIWYLPNTKAGATYITVEFTGGGFFSPTLQVYEVSGIKISSSIDVTGNSIGNQVSPFTSAISAPPITTLQNNDFILTGVAQGGENASSVNTPYRLASPYDDFPGDINSVATYVPPGIVNSQAAIFNTGAASAFAASVATFLAEPPVTPLATLYVSKDFGKTWINVGTRSMGATGQLRKRVIWRNLGRYRQVCTFKLVVSDCVQVFVLGAKAIVKVGIK